ncbi:zinc finger protein VAR3, chloroplastic-like [Tasmannia lanceolata]|uniref:zinc finger protein VAR3, chloroplastic-like n=1 Tax=Tasmannia lanceolata TaxID=3420 RepID=UPI004063DCAC
MGGASKIFMLLRTPFPLIFPRPFTLHLARRSRVSLPLFSASQNHRLFSNSLPRLGFSIRSSEQIHTQTVSREEFGESVGFSSNSRVSHPWPEWQKLVENLWSGGYFNREIGVGDDEFSVFEDLPEEFVRSANACLWFARDRSDLLRLLSKKDIEVIVENGVPFLFKDATNSTRRLRSFLGSNGRDVLEFERACAIDVMRFLLSYTYSPLTASDQNNVNNRELVEVSVRNLLRELADLSGKVGESGFFESAPIQVPAGYEQSPRPFGQNIEMKRGDWICPKCSFMNFARNMKCLECDEQRPKRQLTGGEWECPQCVFFNYGRNTVCLMCDCKRPGETSFSSANLRSDLGYGQKLNIDRSLTGNISDRTEIERRLAENDQKAERWFSKVSQLDNVSDLSSAIEDEDFPEIMPLRKGVNRFVVSTRKTPLERRLANAQYRRNLGNDGSAEGNNFQNDVPVGGFESDNTPKTSISQSLDRILGRASPVSETDQSYSQKNDNLSGVGPKNTGTEVRLTSPQYRHSLGNQGSDSGYVPFVPLPADMFKSPKPNAEEQATDSSKASVAANAGGFASSVPGSKLTGNSSDGLYSEKLENQTEIKKDKDQSDASERWFKKVAELHDVTDLASAISDEDFPEIMPMRKGENRFVVSKKKDRSLTSPQYKRRLAMEQANSSNFVPFVPFPPDYFAKKDKQPEAGSMAEKAASETSTVSSTPEKLLDAPEKSWSNPGSPIWEAVGNSDQKSEYQQTRRETWNTDYSTRGMNEGKVEAVYRGASGNSTQRHDNLEANGRDNWNGGFSGRESLANAGNVTGGLTQQSENQQNSKENWNRGFTGKSLEGSAVKEPDPLDMSEEAKAERWFRRVAQINDISELSKIPDEDFPSIMPMRKGVNRFVVSKRKTPLERRLTSPQYRRNLPIVSSDPPEKDPS